MGCGCGGAKAEKKTYIYTSGDGKQTSWGSQIEAQAAKVRDSHRGSIRVETAR